MHWFNSSFVTQTFSFLACKIGNWTSMKWLGYDQQFSMHKVISHLKYTEDQLAYCTYQTFQLMQWNQTYALFG